MIEVLVRVAHTMADWKAAQQNAFLPWWNKGFIIIIIITSYDYLLLKHLLIKYTLCHKVYHKW